MCAYFSLFFPGLQTISRHELQTLMQAEELLRIPGIKGSLPLLTKRKLNKDPITGYPKKIILLLRRD